MDSWVAINHYSWIIYQERIPAAEGACELTNLRLSQGARSLEMNLRAIVAAWLQGRELRARRAAPQQLQTT